MAVLAMPESDFDRRQEVLTQIVQLCAAGGLKDAIISPGSRSAPLTAAFAASPAFTCRVVPDERSAAYIALGLAQQTRLPTVLICTSGTAALNYGPAVAEAFYQQIPLLVLTADRPAEWIDQQDNQAIHQNRLYEPHVRASFSLPADLGHPDARWYTVRSINEAIARTRRPLPGPVHVNVPLREPLYPAFGAAAAGEPEELRPAGKLAGSSPARGVQSMEPRTRISEESWNALLDQWQTAGRKLVVAGAWPPDSELRRALQVMGRRKDLAVIADITANLPPESAPVQHAEAILAASDAATRASLQPDLLISFGGPLTSNALKQFLRSAPLRGHWRIQPAGEIPDTFQTLSHAVPMTPTEFFAALTRRAPLASNADYLSAWQPAEARAAAATAAFLERAPFGEFQAMQRVLATLPAGSILQLGNSMPIRYANLVGLTANAGLAGVFSNRGVSGIDGTVSTAVGAALGSGRLTTLLVGDLGFFYDRNGLWHGHVPANLRIVLLNNHGGGIFDLIDGPNRLPAALHETYFLTPQLLTAQRTASDHGLDYLHAADGASLDAALASFFAPHPRAALLEIESDMATNSQLFRQFKALIAQSA